MNLTGSTNLSPHGTDRDDTALVLFQKSRHGGIDTVIDALDVYGKQPVPVGFLHHGHKAEMHLSCIADENIHIGDLGKGLLNRLKHVKVYSPIIGTVYPNTCGKFITVEMNMGQMIEDVKLATECKVPVTLCKRVGGMIPSPDQVLEAIKNAAKGGEN